jgi:TM2 domain-containing membrane protein YozV
MLLSGSKSVPVAIFLNLLIPGMGMVYLGNTFTGIVAIFVTVTLVVTTSATIIVIFWIAMNAVLISAKCYSYGRK